MTLHTNRGSISPVQGSNKGNPRNRANALPIGHPKCWRQGHILSFLIARCGHNVDDRVTRKSHLTAHIHTVPSRRHHRAFPVNGATVATLRGEMSFEPDLVSNSNALQDVFRDEKVCIDLNDDNHFDVKEPVSKDCLDTGYGRCSSPANFPENVEGQKNVDVGLQKDTSTAEIGTNIVHDNVYEIVQEFISPTNVVVTTSTPRRPQRKSAGQRRVLGKRCASTEECVPTQCNTKFQTSLN